jgi:tape measure domain-containing protein
VSLSLGTLEIGLGLNTAQYDSGIKSAKDQLSSLEQKVITPKVDHRPLDALNQHLTVKENHYDKLNKKIIAPKVNHVALEALNEYLTVTEKRIDEFNKKVIKVQVDDTELLALQKQLEETLALQNQVIESSKETTIKPTTDSQNLTKLQKDHEKTNIAQEKTRKKAHQNVSITTNNQNLTKLDQQHKQTQIKTIPVTTEQQSTIQKPSSVEQQNITQRPVATEQQNISQKPNIRGGGFSAMVAVELLSQILSGSLTKILSAVLPAILKVVETRKNFVSAVMSMPANFLKSYSEGAAYTYADIFTRNNIKAFDKEAGTNLYETGGSDLGKLAGKTVRKGKTVLNEHLETESAQKGSEAIADATKRTKEEMAELKKLAIEFYNTQDPSKAQELAEQLLKVSDSMRQVAMSPIDTFANARKELKSGESIAKAREQSATVQLDEKAVSEAKKIVFVSGGFAGKQGEGSKEIAENLQPKLEDGVLVIPIANKATDLSTSIKDNPLKWAGEAAAQTVGQGLSGTNEDSVSMLAAVIKARELNPNAQIDLLGYSAGGFVSEGATRLANQAGIENIKGVAIATPSMVGTTQIDNFSRYMGENDPIRLAEQTMGASDVSKQSQVISGIASHSSSDYLENAEIIKILNKEVDKLQENIEDIPDQLELFDMSSLQLKQRELVAIETQLKEVKEATKPLEHLKVDSIVATNIPNIKLGTEEKSFEIPSISSKNNPSKNITTDNKVSSNIGVKEKELVSLSKQTKDLKSLIQSNPASADIVKAQAQTDAIRKWFSDRYQKLKTLIDSGELDQAKKVANEILIAKEQASSDLEDILKLLKEAGQPTSIASGGVGASVQSAKGYLSSTGKKVQTAQETIGIKELSPIKSGLIQQIQKTGVDTTTVGFKTLFAKAIEQSAKSIASGGNKELIEANLEKLILSLNPVLANKNKTKGLGSDIIEGIKIGIKSESGDLDAEMREIALTLPKTIRDTLEIQSPSKVMMRIGRDIKRGLILGLDGIKTELKFKEIEIKDFVGKVKSLDRESLKTNVQKAGKRIFNALPSNVRSEVKFRQWEMEESAKQMQPLNRETIKTNIKQVGRKVFNIGGILDKIDDFKSKSKLEQFSTIADKVERSLDKLPEPIKKVAGLIRNAILGIVGFNILESTIGLLNKFGKEAFQTAIEAERLEMALSLTTDDAESALSRLKVQADKLGTSFLSSAKNYQQFSAAVMNTSLEFQKDKIFEGITLGLATRGANSQQQDRALLAITQIASKGRVSMEELNSQLGEAMPGALQIASRAYGVTAQEFIKLIESGSVASDEFLSKFATQTTLESAGGINVINDTAFAQVAKLENQLNLLRVEMGKPLLEVAKLGIPTVISGLTTLEDHGDKIVATFVSMGIVVSGVFVQMLHRLGLLKLGLKALGVTAASTKASIAQIGIGFVKGLGWTALVFGVMEAFKGLYQYINAGSEESKRSLKSTQESLQELRRLLEKPLPTPKASTVITDSATAIQQFKNNRERDKSLEFTAGGLSDTTQILKLSTDTFSDTKITEFTGNLDTLRQKAKDLKIDEIIASGNADVKKATSVRQEIAKVNQEIQALTEKYFPQIGLIVNEIASTEERITAIKKVLDDPGSSSSQKDNARIQLEITEVQLRKLKESQEKYNEAVKENLINYQRLTEQINKVARALFNIEFVSSGRTILSETDIKRQVLSGNLKPFEIDLTVREQSLSIVKDQFNSLNGLLATKEKELQNTLTDLINQRITELMPELNGIDFRTALQQGSVSPEAIGDRLQQLGDQAPFELKQVLETAKQQASIRRQTLTIDKSIVDTELEIANARRERARNARQASIVGANVNERIATLRQLPFGGPAASYQDALSEVRNQERLLGEAYRRLESASDDPNVIQQEVDNTRLALEQARANLLQQQTSLQDYYRNLDRQIIDFNRQIEDYRRQIEDAQLSAFKENRSLSESYSDLVRELDKNLLNAQNQLLDTTDRIRVQQVKNRLLIPGTSDAGKELGDIFLEFVQGQADLASRGRTFQSRTEEIETSYISTLRNIRNLQEQQQEAERNRLRTIEDIKRTQEDLNRTLADLIRQTNKELGFIPQSIKDIVTNLNTLPEPIKLINSELVAIPPNIKTSGEDLVKSIEETAEAIRKAKEGLILPAPSNFAPAPVWNGGGFLPPPASFSTFPTSSTLPSTLTPRGQQASQYLNNPQIRAFLDLVAYAEGTDYMPNEGYNTLFGHGQFVSFRDHPRQRVSKNGLRSDAAGRYQIMQATWDEEKAKLGLQDFSPTSQDLVAISRIMMRGALDEVLKGDVVGALFAARQEWAAFPGAGYGQRERSKESLTRKYQEIVKKYEQPSSTPSASTSSTIFVRRSGQKTPEGLEILRFDLIKDGKIIDTVIGGVTGRPSTQSAIGTNKTNIRGSETPLPDGNWSIDANHASRYLRQFNSGQFRNYNPSQIPVGTVGPAWIGAEPKFSTGRSQIGFHLDDLKIGSAGCLVFTDPNQIAKIANWVVQSGANSMFVDLDGKQTSRGGQGGSRDSIPSPSPSVQQQITNRLPKNIQSVLVQEVGGETVYSKNAQTPPASPASTIKVIIADLIAKEIASGKLSLKDAIAIKSPLVDPHGQLKANQVRTVEQLIQLMLEKSDNTATNVLIDRLGGLTRATELAKKEGYKNTTISRYLNIPGSGTPNISTAQDVTLAMQSLIKNQNPASQLAEQSLRQTRNFKYNNEIGGKIGNNSKVIGNVGLVNINGKEYIVTAYANINGNQLNNRTIITNATNAISQSIKDSTPNPSPVPMPTSVPVLQPPRVLTKEETKEGKGGPEFSSPPPIAQLPTLPNQNQDNFWDADLPPVPKDNPINFQSPNLPPVPNLPTGNLDAAADQIRNAETANQNAEELLRQLEASFLIDTTLDRAIKFGRQQEEDARALERTLRDASENVADLTINSKGYLTVQEEINKSATEVSRQYRSQIESLEDQRRTLLLNADGWQKMSENIKKVVAEQIALGKMPADVAEQFLKNADALAKRVESAKEQVTILDQAIERLGKNQGVATLEASFRKTRDTVRSIRDRLNDLTIQRLKLENQSRPTLFDDSAILAERISLQKEKEELEDYLEPYKDLPQYADFVANIRSEWEKLAELRLERVALDASPNRGAAESFFSDIREGKGIGSAFSSLGLNIATKFVEGITKPAIDALTSAIDGFTKPITQAFESVFNAIIGPVGNFFTNALNSIFKPVGNIFSSIFGGGGGGGLFNGLLSGITGIFSGGLGGLGSIGSLGSIGASSFASAPASAFSLGTGFSLFSDGGKVGDANVPIEKNIISAFQRERAMSGGRKPRLIVANEDELILNPKETEAYLDYRNNAPIKNYANGGFVGGKPNYSTTSNNNSSNQSLIINNTNNVTVESRNDMGYSLNQLKERENTQNERTKKRFFG